MYRNFLKSITIIRCQPHRCYVRRIRKRLNPGIDNQLQAFEDDEHYQDDPEDFNEFESDFQNVHESHKQYEKETKQFKENIRNWTVETKYFKKKEVNFLTWAEKEQIRYLHSKDSVEWNIEKLSESFPADSLAISKILKSPWVPRDEIRILKHDASVNKSWELFAKNEIPNLTFEQKQHLEIFSNRKLANTTITGEIKRTNKPVAQLPVPNSKEYSSIITSCKGYKDVPALKEKCLPLKQTVPKNETFILGKISNNKPMIFKDLSNEVHSKEKSINTYNPFRNPNGTGITDGNIQNAANIQKYDSYEVQANANDLKQLSMPSIREHITIPRRLFKSGATYKLGDCYYDDDGEFLYRVPGMISEKK